MKHPDGVIAEVRGMRHNHAFDEYKHTDPNNSLGCRCYVESKVGKQFFIATTLSKDFDYHGAEGALVKISIDGGYIESWKFCAKPSYPDEVETHITRIVVWDEGRKAWLEAGFSFAQLKPGKLNPSMLLHTDASH